MKRAQSMESEIEVDARLQSPFTALVAGPTGSGKTRVVLDLIAHADKVSVPPPVKVVYC